MALPFTLDLTFDNNNSVGTFIRYWTFTVPADRLAGTVTSDQPGFLSVVDGAYDLHIGNQPGAGIFTRVDLTQELEDARMLLQDAAGTTTYREWILTDTDRSEPYTLGSSSVALPSANLRLRFETPFEAHDLAPQFSGTASGALVATLARTAHYGLAPVFAGSGSGELGAAISRTEDPNKYPVTITLRLVGAQDQWRADSAPAALTAGKVISSVGTELLLRAPEPSSPVDAWQTAYTLASSAKLDTSGALFPTALSAAYERARLIVRSLDGATVYSDQPIADIANTYASGRYALAAFDTEPPATLTQLVLVFAQPFENFDLAPQFSGAASGELAATVQHTEAAEDIPLEPAFTGSAAGTLAATISHLEVAEAVPLAPEFSGSASGEFVTTIRLFVDHPLAPAFAGTARGRGFNAGNRLTLRRVQHHDLPNIWAGEATGVFTATLVHGEFPERFTIRPAFAGSASGAFAAPLAKHDAVRFDGSATGVFTATLVHGEFPERFAVRPAFAGSATGTLAVTISHTEAAEALTLAPEFAGRVTGTLAAKVSVTLPVLVRDPGFDVRILFELAADPNNAFPNDNLWSGEGVLNFEGRQYAGIGGVVRISEAISELGPPSGRLSISFDATNAAVRAATRDPGPRLCTLRWISSTDGGLSWTAVPRRTVGRLSAPVLDDAEFTVILELESGDRVTRAPLMWSEQDIRARSTDTIQFGGGAYLAELEAGLTADWPA